MKKVNVCLWLYDTDLADEFIKLLVPVQDLIYVHLGLCESNNNKASIKKFKNSSIDYHPYFYPNAGADILSFLSILNTLDDDATFLKIHSKKSPWGIYQQCNWRAILLDSLIGSRQKVIDNIKLLEENKNVLIANKFFMLNNLEGINSSYIKHITKKFNITTYSKYFAAGTMFYGHKCNFMPFINNLDYFSEHLLKYKGKVNDDKQATMPHALERLFGYIHQKYTYTQDLKYTLRIKSDQATKINLCPSKYVHLNILYNKDCYLMANANYYGKVLKHTANTITIRWIYLEKPVEKTYYKVSNKTFSST